MNMSKVSFESSVVMQKWATFILVLCFSRVDTWAFCMFVFIFLYLKYCTIQYSYRILTSFILINVTLIKFTLARKEMHRENINNVQMASTFIILILAAFVLIEFLAKNEIARSNINSNTVKIRKLLPLVQINDKTRWKKHSKNQPTNYGFCA